VVVLRKKSRRQSKKAALGAVGKLWLKKETTLNTLEKYARIVAARIQNSWTIF
jgi:hypothetical protein